MTQPPPTGSYEPHSAPPSDAEPLQGPPPYSASAIAAFVLSLLGCLGVTAVLGLIFAVVGLLTTRGGARRGAGFAIAAIPISIVTGLMAFVLVAVAWQGVQTTKIALDLPAVYDVDGGIAPDALAKLRGVFTESFNAEVSAEKLAAWFESIRTEYGVLVELQANGKLTPIPNTDRWTYRMTGKFVSGTQSVEVIMRVVPPFAFQIDDVVVAGASPRPSH